MSMTNIVELLIILLGSGMLFFLAFRLLQRLQWHITLCYILVALVVIPLLIIPLALADPGPQQDVASVMASRVAPRVAAYLEQTPPNGEALAVWASAFVHRASDQETVFAETILGETTGPLAVAVLDQGHHLLLSASSGKDDVPDLVATSQAQQVIQAASRVPQGKPSLAKWMQPFPDGRMAVAVPLLASNGRFLGILFTVVTLPATQQALIVSALQSLPQNLLPLLVLASLPGMLAGVLASQSITRRVRRLAQAAHAWSLGEFQVLVHDASRDELGQLARDFNHMAAQVRSLLARQQSLAVIEERHRVARDLHDSVKQHIFATTLLIGAARELVRQDAQTAETYLVEAEELATQTRRELTAIIQAMRPMMLAEKGLVAVLHDYLMLWSRRTNMAFEMQIAYASPAPLEIEETLLRVAQEVLANAARHSEASRVQLDLVQEDALLRLTIDDNGKGFDVARAERTGWGILHMRERVEAHRGRLCLSSTPLGTRVEVHIPFIPTALTPISLSHKTSGGAS